MAERFPTDHAILFFDGIDHQTNQKVAISFNNFMFRHHAGTQCRHILPVPNFSDSLVTPGVQLADVLAYCVNERYVGHGRQGHLEDFFVEFRNLSFTYQNPDEGAIIWGFQAIPAEREGVALEHPEQERQQNLL